MWRIESFTKVVLDKDERVCIPYDIMVRYTGFDIQLNEVTEKCKDSVERKEKLVAYFKENGVPAIFVSKRVDGKYIFKVIFNVEDDGFFYTKTTEAVYEFQHKDVMEFKMDNDFFVRVYMDKV